jgi:undecaprenyl-diphosphatase
LIVAPLALISYGQAIVLGLLQGVSELFPISSLGHSVILPRIFGWDIHQNDSFFLTFLIATHLATALVLVGFFWRDWVRIVRGLGRSLAQREIAAGDTDAKLGWLLIVGTIPAGILGLLLQDPLRKVFAYPASAAVFLTLNGVLLYGAERLRRRAPTVEPEDAEGGDARIVRRVGWREALGIGGAQALALIPGFSRSGATMGGGLLAGLSNEDAARFAFLLATPIIGAAALLKLPDLFGSDGNGVRGPALVGSLCAAASAYVAIRFLMRFLETNRLTPFAYYCAGAGVAASVYLAV